MAEQKIALSVSRDDEATEARFATACRTFWSDHALNREFRSVCGDRPFTLKEFIAFVVGLPSEQFFSLAQRHPGESLK
jgi:hypothetical protein